MFNGIVRKIGVMKKIDGDENLKTFTIFAPDFMTDKKQGDSISVDGVCLTVKDVFAEEFSVEVMPETMSKSIVNTYKEEQKLNLEHPLKVGDYLDGHYLSGHVDFTGTIKSIEKSKETIKLEISIPSEFLKFFPLKGSVAINGVSLTISKIERSSFQVSIIPQTMKNTNLGILNENDPVNIEVDMFSRYLSALLENKESEITYEFLRERNFI